MPPLLQNHFQVSGHGFLQDLKMAKSDEHASRPLLAFAYRIRRFVREHAFADRPHTSLWLAKHMLSLLACMVVKYGVLFFAGGQGIL